MRKLKEEHLLLFKKLGENIKAQREKENISIKELSQKTGIRAEYLKKIEQGLALRITTTKIFNIATNINIKPSLLVKNIQSVD